MSVMFPPPVSGECRLAAPRDAIRRPMWKLAELIGGPVDLNPARRFANTQGGLLLPRANLLVLGTALPRPALGDAAATIADMHGLNVILVRFSAFAVQIDLRLQETGHWLDDCRLWRRGSALWLLPREFASPYVEAAASGLIQSAVSPYRDARELYEGLVPCGPFALLGEVS